MRNVISIALFNVSKQTRDLPLQYIFKFTVDRKHNIKVKQRVSIKIQKNSS